jgi:hypothetical protein
MKLVQQLQDAGQDHEFYPTTQEIITALFNDLLSDTDDDGKPVPPKPDAHWSGSVLDIGAGNGKVLDAFAQRGGGPLYAIEKSPILQQALPPEVFIIGADFAEQTLHSKPVDVIFCNPPYSQFRGWMTKIIRTAACSHLYLVVPRRWQDDPDIAAAIHYRGLLLPDEVDPDAPPPVPENLTKDELIDWYAALPSNQRHNLRYKEFRSEIWFTPRESPHCHIVGEFDFEDAEDRSARAKVHLLRLDLQQRDHRIDKDDTCTDAFERFFREQFADLIAGFDGKLDAPDKWKQPEPPPDRFPLVTGESYVESLVACYYAEMAHIEANYRAIGQLDANLLREFEVYPAKIMAGLKLKLDGLRHDYWNELFDRFSKITARLTTGSREALLARLRQHVQVDFTVANIHAIVLWVLKNASRYLESQLIHTYEKMVAHCNVVNYKSNQRTWQKGDWRYNTARGKNVFEHPNTHYALDYRIVMESVGGICTYEYNFQKEENNHLKTECFDFLRDLLTIANNLGFPTSSSPHVLQRRHYKWASNVKEEFYFHPSDGSPAEVLFDARAFKNGNLHLRLNQRFILALNVEHGRLKGWLNDAHHAASELGDLEAARFWNTHYRLPASGNPNMLLAA